MDGYIYLLVNKRLHGLVKIGFTETTVEQRLYEINCATGVAEKFEVYKSYKVKNAQKVESLIHEKLKKYRTRPHKEFFEIKPSAAMEYVEKIINNETFGLTFDLSELILFSSMPELGSLIKKHRKNKNLTQLQVSEILGSGLRFISDIENGKDTAQIGMVLKLLKLLNIRIALDRI